MPAISFIKKSPNEVILPSIIVPETFTHSIAFGQTGCGKTTSFIYPNLENRLLLGHGILFYDYKGKEHLSVKFLAEKAGRLNDVIEIGKPWGACINMIENMDEEELDTFFENILHHEKDRYWQNSATSLGQSVLKVLKAIDGFAKCMNKIDKDFEKKTPFIYSGSYNYPTKRTLTALVNVCNTSSTLNKFIDRLGSLIPTTTDIIKKSMQERINNKKDLESLKPIYMEIISSRNRLIEVIRETRNALESFGKGSNENLTQNIVGCLITPLLSLSQNSFFNTNSFDIVSALNEGKIVVINAESLSDATLESLNNIILHELTKRTRSIKINPISIFIDEAQRLLSKNTDLPIDILREAKVDVFLSTQNSALLKNKLTTEKFDALIGNLTQKFYFKNSTNENIETLHQLNLLKAFEFISNENNFSTCQVSKPLYIEISEKIKIEFFYQKQLNVLVDYAYSMKNKNIVLEYIPILYRDKKLLAINTKTMKESVIDSLTKKDITEIDEMVNFFIKEFVHDLNNRFDVDDDMELELVS